MTRTSKIFIYICMVGLAAFYACSDKETPQPVEDTARVDALRIELRDLRTQVLGLDAQATSLELTEKELKAEIEKLNSVYAKVVTYTVVVTDLQGNNLTGATVKLTQDGAVKSATTDANGLATFAGVHGGNVSASVEATGFAKLIFRAEVADYSANTSYAANSHVSLIPVGGSAAADAGMATVNLDLYVNYTTVDDTLGGPNYWAGSDITKALPLGPDGGTTNYTKVTDKKVSINFSQDAFNSINSTLFTTNGVGRVLSTVFEGTTVTASAATNGTYVIKVPASVPSVISVGFAVSFEEFTANFTQYVPNGEFGDVHVDPPFSKTYTLSQVFRVGYDTFSSPTPGGTLNIKEFYYNSNN